MFQTMREEIAKGLFARGKQHSIIDERERETTQLADVEYEIVLGKCQCDERVKEFFASSMGDFRYFFLLISESNIDFSIKSRRHRHARERDGERASTPIAL